MKRKVKNLVLIVKENIISKLLKTLNMKNKNIDISEIGLFLSCVLMVIALIYIRIN